MADYKVALKGSYLPGIGGISVHIYRLAKALSDEKLLFCVYSTDEIKGLKENKFIVKDAFYPRLRYGPFQSLWWVFKYCSKDKSDIIHFHGHPIWEAPAILLLLMFKKRIVYTIHDQIMLSDFKKYPWLFLYMFKKISQSNKVHWILVNQNIKSQMERNIPGISSISVIPAYLPANQENSSLNPEIEKFIKSKSKIISIYAHSVRKINGKDLYGIDLALKAIAAVKGKFPEIGLIISMPSHTGIDDIQIYMHLIDEFQLHSNILFFLEPLTSASNLWKRSDIVLRPTLSDGDSLVIREALSQGTYVIASDVVQRPEGVILFRNEDIEDLSEKILEILSKSTKLHVKQNISNYELIKAVYEGLL